MNKRFYRPGFRCRFGSSLEGPGAPPRIFKRDDHGLADVLPLAQLSQKVVERLDDVAAVAAAARPVG